MKELQIFKSIEFGQVSSAGKNIVDSIDEVPIQDVIGRLQNKRMLQNNTNTKRRNKLEWLKRSQQQACLKVLSNVSERNVATERSKRCNTLKASL